MEKCWIKGVSKHINYWIDLISFSPTGWLNMRTFAATSVNILIYNVLEVFTFFSYFPLARCLQLWCSIVRNVHPGTSKSWKSRRASFADDEPRVERPGTAMPADRPWSETNYAGDNRWIIKSCVTSIKYSVKTFRNRIELVIFSLLEVVSYRLLWNLVMMPKSHTVVYYIFFIYQRG